MEQKVIDALNAQINFELYSGYVYLHLGLRMEKENYKGYSSWLMKHYQEELAHAQDFIQFMLKRDATPTLKDIHMEQLDLREPLEVAKYVLEHEKKVTKRIYELHDTAKSVNDYATEIFMHKYIEEQIEEEDLAKDILDRFTLAGDSVAAKISVDNSVGAK